MTSESTNSKANGNIGMNEIRALSDVELDAVSGGVMKTAFDFKVAGMHIQGGYDTSNGNYGVMVGVGGSYTVTFGTV